MAMWPDWILWVVIGLVFLCIPLEVYIIVKARKRLPAAQLGSPLQILDKRLADGEISAEEYQYERFLLEKGR
ncbi:MAG TPA: SHOCT domain-containing protein [Candidatus Dormibacteraeota bacterium]|nr:SHOCT domain-containing protein [Candidatus Dormibacteraeota bacterium]